MGSARSRRRRRRGAARRGSPVRRSPAPRTTRPSWRSREAARGAVVVGTLVSLVGALVATFATLDGGQPATFAAVLVGAPPVVVTALLTTRATLLPQARPAQPGRLLAAGTAAVVLLPAVVLAAGESPGSAAAFLLEGSLLAAVALLGGVLVAWVLLVPLLVLGENAVRAARGEPVAPAAVGLALLLLGVVGLATSMTFATKSDLRPRSLVPALVLVGVRLEAVEVVSQPWLWAARASGLLVVASLAGLAVVGHRLARRTPVDVGGRS